jgi:hypothetical protein
MCGDSTNDTIAGPQDINPKDSLPRARLISSFHEAVAICMNEWQKRGSRQAVSNPRKRVWPEAVRQGVLA